MSARAGTSAFLPTSRGELDELGWDELDILIVTGDAYVDHPAFGPVLIARFLQHLGYRVGVIPQPRWDTTADLRAMGTPRLFVGVSAGNLDSMLNRLTAQKKLRSEDPYAPGGRPGLRPNRASVVYANACREAFPGVPVVLGGIEASLRRIAHYDYWSDSVRRSVLLDSKADLLVFGMGERAIAEVAARLAAGEPVSALRDVRGTAHVRGKVEQRALMASLEQGDDGPVLLPPFEEVARSREAFARMTRLFLEESNPRCARPLLQPHGEEAVYLNVPALPLDERELDALYALPFTRREHPRYEGTSVPALESVKHSLVAHRGCFGGCAFCSIAVHQGRSIQSRSSEGVAREARALVGLGSFKGTITDVGGPTANMYRMGCRDPRAEQACRRGSCLHPRICRNLTTDHRPLLELLQRVSSERGVKHVYVASGVRCDLAERSPEFVQALALRYTGGQLSVAPEHTDPHVLSAMRKPPSAYYERFVTRFAAESARAGRRQFLVPYFVVGHPGSTLKDTAALACWIKRHGLRPRQVQEFIPTPSTLSTAMYHTGLDPMTGEALTVTRDPRERRMMKALVMWWDEEQHALGREALRRAGREDLVGRGPECLIPPPGEGTRGSPAGRARRRAPRG